LTQPAAIALARTLALDYVNDPRTRRQVTYKAVPSVLALVFCASACGGGGTPVTPTPPPAPTDTLKAAAASVGKLVGTAVQSRLLNGQYEAVASREFSYITAEYEMKWNVHEPSPGFFDFGAGDAIVGYAMSRGQQMKGHALIWHGATPNWVNGLSPAEMRAALERHIRTVAGHYRGRIHAWDVVNEAVSDDGVGLRDTVFRQKLGDSYIADAFRLAREADPQARLFYNDYGGEGLSAKSNRIYDLVRDLIANGVPIDGVGLQMHISASSRPPNASIASNIRRLADLGLTVHISEMDVRVNGVSGSQQTHLDVQRTTYYDVVRVCVLEPRCEAVTFWGFTDAHTWISGDSPLLFDAQYSPKPAYTGVLDALRGR
jgi:endo-1,4-beta-xylanase